MEHHKIIRPNIFYATFVQFLTIFIYVMIAIIGYKIITYMLGIDMLDEIYMIIKSLEFDGASMIMDFIIDNIHSWIILTVTPIILLLMNIVNQKIVLTDDSIILKNGFILIREEKFLLNEIVRYNMIKDLGFLNTGSLELFTIYGDRIKIDYVLGLNKVSKYLDKLVDRNKKQIKSSNKINMDPEKLAKKNTLEI